MDRELLAKAKAAIQSVEPGAEVILYGSRARGDARPDSDWDLLVLLDGEVDRARMSEIRGVLLDVELETEAVISSIIRGRAEWDLPPLCGTPFHTNVQREGIRV